MAKVSRRKEGLTTKIEDGQLVVRIGVEVLASAIRSGDRFHNDDSVRTFAITDVDRFAQDVANQLENESEDGNSLISGAIEDAAQAAIDDGTEGCEYDRKIEYGENGKGEGKRR